MRKLLYAITHTTAYDYVGEVSVSHHLLRLAPRQDVRQMVLSHQLIIQPHPATVSVHRDYFGNTAHFVGIESPHQRLVIQSASRVAVGLAFVPEAQDTPAWESVRARCHQDLSGATLEALEFLQPSPLVPADDELAAYSDPSFPADRPVLEAVIELTQRIHEDFTFDPTATTVTTPLSEVFKKGRGVCQDFAHLQIACLRAQGLPARYVSGYLETDPPPGQPKLRGVDASHAWVSFFCPGVGWIDADPTNNCLPSLRHITVAFGRDFSDVGPVRGVLIGGQNQALRVAVDMIALGAWEGVSNCEAGLEETPGSGVASVGIVSPTPYGHT
jgi:transglutaminase-like putative cysteine protease